MSVKLSFAQRATLAPSRKGEDVTMFCASSSIRFDQHPVANSVALEQSLHGAFSIATMVPPRSHCMPAKAETEALTSYRKISGTPKICHKFGAYPGPDPLSGCRFALSLALQKEGKGQHPSWTEDERIYAPLIAPRILDGYQYVR